MKLISKWKAVLFDLDGTLLDTAPDFITSTKQLLKDRNLPDVPDEVIRGAVTDGSKGIIQKVFSLPDGDPQLEPLRLQLIEFYFDRLHLLTRPFPGIPQTLDLLAQFAIPWGIVTNKPSRFTEAILERMPFAYPPKVVVCPDHVTLTKPHPEAIELACNKLGLQPGQVVYIGDHARDIEAGKRAGSATIAACYGYTAGETPWLWGADNHVFHAGELISILFEKE